MNATTSSWWRINTTAAAIFSCVWVYGDLSGVTYLGGLASACAQYTPPTDAQNTPENTPPMDAQNTP